MELIHTTPTFIFGAISNPRLIFSVHTLEDNPYFELLAIDTASLGVLKGITLNTGPKISV